MEHTNLILIISIITISSFLGLYVVVKKVNQYSSPPVNVLRRRGDIELDDYNEPTLPLQAYFPQGSESNTDPIDFEPIVHIRNNFGNIPYSQPGLRSLNSYQAEITPVEYFSVLENEINSDFII
jgi:hypothetical protein